MNKNSCCSECENITRDKDGEESADCSDESCKCHKEEECNFMQIGRTFQCSNCHPEKGYADYHKEVVCECICHDEPKQPVEQEPVIPNNYPPELEQESWEAEWKDRNQYYIIPKEIIEDITKFFSAEISKAKESTKRECCEIAEQWFTVNPTYRTKKRLLESINNLK